MKFLLFLLFIINICFANTVSISGSIFNDEGKPSRKAEVELLNIFDEVIYVVKTNRKGRFEMLNVDPDYYYLTVNHPKDGSVRIKINPRKERNRDLILRLSLQKDNSDVLIYTFSNVKPILKDPALRIKSLTSNVDEKAITLNWKKSKQAVKYQITRNGNSIDETYENAFIDSSLLPGVKYCYRITAIGKYNLKGVESEPSCNSALTMAPKNISGAVNKNNITLKWDKVNGAQKYIVKRNGLNIGLSDFEIFNDSDLEYSRKYFYSITSLSSIGVEGLTSAPFEITTRAYVEPPALSSIIQQTSIKLIWNEVELAVSYNLYRDGGLIGNIIENSYEDNCYTGETHCYQITSIDKYNVESGFSGKHCSKLNLKSPSSLNVLGGIKSNRLSWTGVQGAFEYLIFKSIGKDSTLYLNKTKNTSFLDNDLGYNEDHCYVVQGYDSEGDKSGFSKIVCGTTNNPPLLKIKNVKLIDDSQNSILEAEESGKLRFAIINEGGSPSKNIEVKIENHSSENSFLQYDSLKLIEAINIDQAKYIDFIVKADLKVKSGDLKFQIIALDENGFKNDKPFEFIINTKAVEQPNIILADYSIENSFGTNYIPKNEIVNLTLRIQNVGLGLTEKVDFILIENHTFSTEDFTGLIQIKKLKPGDYQDLDISVKSEKDQFAIKFKTVDYLDNEIVHQVDLELMNHYRSKESLISQEIGAVNSNPYPIKVGEVDVEKNIPIGKRNVNNMAIILTIDDYEDIDLNIAKYSGRDGEIFRLYMQNLFGMDDYQLYPSKTWQMEKGPSKSDFNKVFDPHQGVIRNRVISSSKYSDVDFVDISIFYSGLGIWLNSKPYIIPQDGKKIDPFSYVSIEELLNSLSLLSVLQNIKSITVYLDVKYINYVEALKNYQYPELSKKISVLLSSSPGENSQESDDMKHSIFSYFLFKGLKGDAMGEDNILELGELAEYLFRKIPDYSEKLNEGFLQNSEFIGSDLKRVLIDLR